MVALGENICIIRVFTKLRAYAFTHKDILLQLAQSEKNQRSTRDIENTFTALKKLIEKQSTITPRNKIGFKLI